MSKRDAISDIRILPTHLANQLAAGEVVERPASVLKELLENSLDAGARNIEVRVSQGGVGLIQVRDDGRGIPREQLALALSRHATSKLHEAADLEAIASLGFRGEALPSIASVAEFEMISATEGEQGAWRVRVDEQGRVAQAEPAAHPRGTTVSVRDLFRNLPARRRFLRATRTELAHVQDVYQRMALSHFEVGFRLQTGERGDAASAASAGSSSGGAAGGSRLPPALDAPARSRRVGAIFGKSFLKHAREFEYQSGGMRLWGWIADAGYHRAQADRQFFFLNRRMVRDKVLNHAVRQAIAELIEPGRHAAYALYLEIDPGQVDVNVHPTKHEVRFRETRQIHDFVYGSLRRALRDDESLFADAAPAVAEEGAARYSPAYGAGNEAGSAPGHVAASGFGGQSAARPRATSRHAASRAFTMPSSAPGSSRYPGQFRAMAKSGIETGGSQRILGTPLAQLHDYLLCRSDDDYLLLHISDAQTALRGRAMRALLNEEPRPRPLLIPYAVALPEREAEALFTQQDSWRALGFELTRAGPERVVLRGVPAALSDCDPQAVYDALRASLGTGAEGATLLDGVLEYLAGQPPVSMSLSEMAALLRGLEQAGLAESSHGLWRRVGARDVKQWFDGGESR